MVWQKNYRLHSISYFPDGPVTATIISGMSTATINGNPDVQREVTAGSIFAETASLNTIRPVVSFTTFNIEAALDGPGLGGAASCITSAVNPGVFLYYARYDCAGPDVTAGDHLQYGIAQGVMVPTSLNVDHRGDATISYDIFVDYDGTTLPIAKSDVAFGGLPVLTGTNSQRWTMDKMEIGGVLVEGKRNITVNFNSTITQEGADSSQYDSVSSIDGMLQQVTVQGVDPDWFEETASPPAPAITGIVGETFLEGDPTRFYLKDRNVPIATTNHILLEFNGLANWDTIVTGDASSPAGSTLNIDLHSDGANPPITATTGVAIPP